MELKSLFFPKNSKKNSGFFTTAAGLTVLILIVTVAAVVYAYGMSEAFSPLIEVLPWFYFCMAGLFIVAVGSIFGIIGVYTSVYRATDNDLLLSLPIRPSLIIFTRIAGNYIVDFYLTAVMWIPFVIKYFILVPPSALAIVFSVLALIFIPLLCSAIALALGFIVSLITMKLKNNGLVVAIIGLIALAGFYIVYFKISGIITDLVANPEVTSAGFKSWGFLFYNLGLSATGDWLAALIFFGITAALFGLCYLIISLTFIKVSTVSSVGGKVKAGKNPYKSRTLSAALLKREVGKFFSNANYLLNCGLSAVFILALGVVFIVLGGKVGGFIITLSEIIPTIENYALLIVPVILLSLLSIGGSATPSVSLEGKALWVIRSVPVKTKSVLMVKEYLQIIITLVPAVFLAIAASVVLGGGVLTVISEAAFAISTALFFASLSLYFGIIKADVNWANETVAIKSNLGVLFVMLIGFASMVALCGVYYLIIGVIGLNLGAEIYISVYTVIMLALFFVINKWIGNKGVKKFESLS